MGYRTAHTSCDRRQLLKGHFLSDIYLRTCSSYFHSLVLPQLRKIRKAIYNYIAKTPPKAVVLPTFS